VIRVQGEALLLKELHNAGWFKRASLSMRINSSVAVQPALVLLAPLPQQPTSHSVPVRSAICYTILYC
jgi:hypothetical protein